MKLIKKPQMKESKATQERWVKASFFTKQEHEQIIHAMKLHQAGKMNLLDVVGIFDFVKVGAITRTRQLQQQKYINQMLDK